MGFPDGYGRALVQRSGKPLFAENSRFQCSTFAGDGLLPVRWPVFFLYRFLAMLRGSIRPRRLRRSDGVKEMPVVHRLCIPHSVFSSEGRLHRSGMGSRGRLMRAGLPVAGMRRLRTSDATTVPGKNILAFFPVLLMKNIGPEKENVVPCCCIIIYKINKNSMLYEFFLPWRYRGAKRNCVAFGGVFAASPG